MESVPDLRSTRMLEPQPAGVDADSVVPASAEELNDEIEAMRSIYGWKLRTLVYPWVRNFASRCIDLYCSCLLKGNLRVSLENSLLAMSIMSPSMIVL